MTQTATDDIADFLTELGRQEVAETTLRADRNRVGSRACASGRTIMAGRPRPAR